MTDKKKLYRPAKNVEVFVPTALNSMSPEMNALVHMDFYLMNRDVSWEAKRRILRYLADVHQIDVTKL